MTNLRGDSRSDNEQDKWVQGTMPAGEKAYLASITNQQARQIKQLIRWGTQRAIVCAVVGGKINVYSNIKRGISWKSV